MAPSPKDPSSPMLAKIADEIPRGPGWTYEPKWDGFRTVVTVGTGDVPEVGLASRGDRPMARFFPELVELLSRRGSGRYVADGEIVLVRPGRLAFDELQLRLHPAESRVRKLAGETPASLILFDLLEIRGDDLRSTPLEGRRARLRELTRALGAPQVPEHLEELPTGPGLWFTPWTDDLSVAERWFADEAGLGQDGIVAKRDDQPYEPGVRGWTKIKHRRTVDCVVGGYRVAKAGDGVGSLLLGLYDRDGTMHLVGHTSSFKAAERRAMVELLEPLRREGTFEGGRRPGEPSRWSGGKDMTWVSLDPVLVCEVSIDRMEGGRFRHAATFIRWRDDRDARSCTFEQLGVEAPPWATPDGGAP
jgi:ATP-dependent DNA ligase